MTPREIAEKWSNRASAAAGDYKKGVQGTTVNPMEEAVKSQDKMRNNFLEALDSGRWAENTLATSFEFWKRQTSEKGSQNYVTGIRAGMERQVAFQEAIAPHREQVRQSVRSLPNATKADREQRMITNARMMGEFKYKRRRR